MPANVYECMFLLDTTKAGGDIAAVDKQLRTLLERNHAEVLVSRPWDERRLSYPIGNQKKGLYYLTYFSTEGKNLVAIERDCHLSELILRQLVLRIDPKLVETMLSLAKGDHAVALHGIHEDGQPAAEGAPAAAPREGGGGEPVEAGAGGPRRGRRNEAREER